MYCKFMSRPVVKFSDHQHHDNQKFRAFFNFQMGSILFLSILVEIVFFVAHFLSVLTTFRIYLNKYCKYLHYFF